MRLFSLFLLNNKVLMWVRAAGLRPCQLMSVLFFSIMPSTTSRGMFVIPSRRARKSRTRLIVLLNTSET